MSDSRALKSKGSSEPTAAGADDDEDEESEREASRAALPPFFSVAGVLLKVRIDVCFAEAAATRLEGLQKLGVSSRSQLLLHDVRRIPEATLSCSSYVPRQQARAK